MNEFNLKSNILLEKIRLLADNNDKSAVTLLDLFNYTTLDILASVGFGMDTNCLNNHSNNDLNKYITECLKGTMKFSEKTISKIDYLNPYEYFYKKYLTKIINKLREIAREQIMTRIKILSDGLYAPTDLLSIALKNNGLFLIVYLLK